MMGYPAAPEIDAMLARASERAADVDVTSEDGVRHQLWVIGDEASIDRLTRAFDALPALYIGDGHHRSAAAARVARSRGANGDSHRHFLAVLFPHHEMTILDYNRVVRDLNGAQPGAIPGHAARTLLGSPFRSADAPRGVGRVWNVSRWPMVPTDDPSGARP